MLQRPIPMFGMRHFEKICTSICTTVYEIHSAIKAIEVLWSCQSEISVIFSIQCEKKPNILWFLSDWSHWSLWNMTYNTVCISKHGITSHFDLSIWQHCSFSVIFRKVPHNKLTFWTPFKLLVCLFPSCGDFSYFSTFQRIFWKVSYEKPANKNFAKQIYLAHCKTHRGYMASRARNKFGASNSKT